MKFPVIAHHPYGTGDTKSRQQIEEVANSLHHCSKTLNPTESCMHSFLLQHRFKNLPEDHHDKWHILQNTKKRDLCDFALIERIEASHGIPSAFCNPNPSLVGDVAASEGGISGKDHNKQGSPRTCVVMTCRFAMLSMVWEAKRSSEAVLLLMLRRSLKWNGSSRWTSDSGIFCRSSMWTRWARPSNWISVRRITILIDCYVRQ